MKTVQRIASIALAVPLALGGAAVIAMPANAAAPDTKPANVKSVEAKSKGHEATYNAKAVEAKAKSAEFKALIKQKVADKKISPDTAKTKEEWKAIIQHWLDENRRGKITPPVVVEPEVPVVPVYPPITGEIDPDFGHGPIDWDAVDPNAPVQP